MRFIVSEDRSFRGSFRSVPYVSTMDKGQSESESESQSQSQSQSPSTSQSQSKSEPKSKSEKEKVDLTQEQRDMFKEVFNEFDKKGNGEITSKELGLVLKALGMELTEPELMDLISEVDEDGNGTIDFEEFLAMMARKMKEAESLSQGGDQILRAAFNILDLDKDGVISAPELKVTMASFGEKMTNEEVEAMMAVVDKNQDGRVTFAEFKNFMKKLAPAQSPPEVQKPADQSPPSAEKPAQNPPAVKKQAPAPVQAPPAAKK